MEILLFVRRAVIISLVFGVMLFIALPKSTQAISMVQLQAQIDELIAQVQVLQAQLDAQGGGQVVVQGAKGYKFTENLKFGDNTDDVYILQKLLNNDPATLVAQYGAGSPGSETTYFGSLTKKAVIKFQNKFEMEVLAPLGLSSGTGFVGPMTRGKLNIIASSPWVTDEVPEWVVSGAERPVILSLTPDTGPDNTEVVIGGTNFSSLNEVQIGQDRYYDVPSSDGKTITIQIDSSLLEMMFVSEEPADVFFALTQEEQDRLKFFVRHSNVLVPEEEREPVIPLYFHVQNNAGLESDPFLFNLTIFE